MKGKFSDCTCVWSALEATQYIFSTDENNMYQPIMLKPVLDPSERLQEFMRHILANISNRIHLTDICPFMSHVT